MKSTSLIALFCLGLSTQMSVAQVQVEPEFSIWDVELGEPISLAPDNQVAEIACGTNGGPPGRPLKSFDDFMDCNPEESGLREVSFTYDDEQDYIALALNSEFKFLHGGTSVFAHPVIVSVLVDPEGIVQGRRIFTDNRVSDYDRRNAVTLIRNFKARFSDWSLTCRDLDMKDGEQPVGKQFIHELCTGESPEGDTLVELEATLLRKKGQEGLNPETREVNTGYFESQTRYEEVKAPYEPGASR